MDGTLQVDELKRQLRREVESEPALVFPEVNMFPFIEAPLREATGDGTCSPTLTLQSSNACQP